MCRSSASSKIKMSIFDRSFAKGITVDARIANVVA
jgi:hypothetical protein